MRDTTLFLKDILMTIHSIEAFIEGMSYAEFLNDDRTSSAVIRKLEIIGEATKHVSDEVRQQNPQIPWKEMAGMWDKLIHFYHGVDYQLVWQTIKLRLPQVKQALQTALSDETS
ncbi:MAG: DUF86 domain-containing protein [Anaerolineales bacterium]